MQWRSTLRNKYLKCFSSEKRFARSIETMPCARADSDNTNSSAGSSPTRRSARAWSIRTMIIAMTGERPAAKSPGYCRAFGAGRKNAASNRWGCSRAKSMYASLSSSSHSMGSCAVRDRTTFSHAARPSSTSALSKASLSAKCRYSAMGDTPARAATLRIVRFAIPSRPTTNLAAEKIRSFVMRTLYTSMRTMYTRELRADPQGTPWARSPGEARSLPIVPDSRKLVGRSDSTNRGKPLKRLQYRNFKPRRCPYTCPSVPRAGFTGFRRRRAAAHVGKPRVGGNTQVTATRYPAFGCERPKRYRYRPPRAASRECDSVDRRTLFR